MTDKELEEKALSLRKDYTSWERVYDMVDQAQSDETKRFLHNIAVSMYHREEAACELL